jgi:hypothetical protein
MRREKMVGANLCEGSREAVSEPDQRILRILGKKLTLFLIDERKSMRGVFGCGGSDR